MSDATFEAILDGIAASPDEPAVWAVLADHLLEVGDPGAALARVQLELFKGISNPDLIGELAEAMARRPKLPHEAYGGFTASWRCGFVVRLEVSVRMSAEEVREVLEAPAARGLHHLRFVDSSRFYASVGLVDASAARLRAALESVTPHLRRCSVDCVERYAALTRDESTEVLRALVDLLPPRVERVDLALRNEPPFDVLVALARRVKTLNLDGTRIGDAVPLLDAAPDTELFFGGTGLAPGQVTHGRARWLAPDAAAWLEHVESGVVVPLTPSGVPCGFDAPSSHEASRLLSLGFGAEWKSAGGEVLEDGARVGDWLLRLR